METKHDLIFFEKRSTPKVIGRGLKFKAPNEYGKQTLRRAATPEEEKQIANGQWVRVDQNGTKGGQPGYKKTRMKGREHLVHELAMNILAHYGVKGMRKGIRKDIIATPQGDSIRAIPVIKTTAPTSVPVATQKFSMLSVAALKASSAQTVAKGANFAKSILPNVTPKDYAYAGQKPASRYKT